jgi:hypothetical protein
VENEKLSADQEIANKSNKFKSILKVRQISSRKSSSPVFRKSENSRKNHGKVNLKKKNLNERKIVENSE